MDIHRLSMHAEKWTGLWRVAVFAILIVSGGCSNTEGRKTAQPDGTGVGSGGAGANLGNDGEFVQDLATKNLSEVELSRMAVDRATSVQVKTFARMAIDDHRTTEDSLKSVVSGQAFAWPAQLDDKHREAVEDLSKKQGPDFDREYLKAMVEGHQNLAAKLEARLDVKSLAEWKTSVAGRTQSQTMPEPKAEMADVQVRPNSSDNALTMKVNEWAAKTYPVVQKHLDTARALEQLTAKGSSD